MPAVHCWPWVYSLGLVSRYGIWWGQGQSLGVSEACATVLCKSIVLILDCEYAELFCRNIGKYLNCNYCFIIISFKLMMMIYCLTREKGGVSVQYLFSKAVRLDQWFVYFHMNPSTVISLLEAPCTKTSRRALLFRAILGITGLL